MKILIVGSGGREHALAWKAKQSSKVSTVFVAPGNAGTALEESISNVNIAVEDISGLIAFAQQENIALTIIGPEVPLVAGIVDAFTEAGLKCFGPSAKAAQLEGSKTYCKDFMARHNIPTAEYQTFTEAQPAIDYIQSKGAPIVVKADGLAAGKGVIVAETEQQAIAAVEDMLSGNGFVRQGIVLSSKSFSSEKRPVLLLLPMVKALCLWLHHKIIKLVMMGIRGLIPGVWGLIRQHRL